MLQYRTAGESHGKYIIALVEGLPAGLPIAADFAEVLLARRRNAAGRSARMEMEDDRVEIVSGIRNAHTTGVPLALLIRNRDSRTDEDIPPITIPRPGHSDLAGMLKYRSSDARAIAERAGGRETAARCAAGSIAQVLLGQFGVSTAGYVTRIGPIDLDKNISSVKRAKQISGKSKYFSLSPDKDPQTDKLLQSIRRTGDSLGGEFVVRCEGVPAGLGSPMQWDERLDARLACAITAIPSVKAVEFGAGFSIARMRGSKAHDPILPGLRRSANNAGGIEGGMSNGEPILIRGAVKPIPTLGKPLASVDFKTGKAAKAAPERADVCAVPAISVVGEAVVAFEIARALRARFGGETLRKMKTAFKSFAAMMNRLK